MMKYRCYRYADETRQGMVEVQCAANERHAAEQAARYFHDLHDWTDQELSGTTMCIEVECDVLKTMRFDVGCKVVRQYTARNRQIIEEEKQ